ncbi:MAG: GTPase, partial [Candidatus Methylopumilus sp.]
KKANEPKKILNICQTLAPHRGDPIKPLRMMIMGVPNVGKSTLMNAILNRRIAKVGDEPAITKQQQRHQINDHMILVDTPGMMWPKIRHPSDGDLLAANNNIGKNAYYEEEVAEKLGNIILEAYPALIKARYKLEDVKMDAIQLLEWIAKKKGFPLKNHGVDLERAASTLLNDYRQGLLGRMSLETPSSRMLMMSRQTLPQEEGLDSDL